MNVIKKIHNFDIFYRDSLKKVEKYSIWLYNDWERLRN